MVTDLNEPHVVSLTYRIENAETVDFDKASPLTVDRGSFRVTVDAYMAKVEMVDHFASVEEAQNVVEPFLRAWELNTDVQYPDYRFRFVYETAEIVGQVQRAGAVEKDTAGTVGWHKSGHKWPDPPQELEVSPDADTLWRRWRRSRQEKREPLLSAAYWALTMLEAAPGLAASSQPRPGSKRRQASAFFNIDLDVLNLIGELTSTRGGDDEERKAEGRATPLSPAERQWLDAAFRALVRRVAERAYHGKPPRRQLRMADLPKLTP